VVTKREVFLLVLPLMSFRYMWSRKLVYKSYSWDCRSNEIKSRILWYRTPCIPLKANQMFCGIYGLYSQIRRTSQAKNQKIKLKLGRLHPLRARASYRPVGVCETHGVS
jgi:hypothetical protein